MVVGASGALEAGGRGLLASQGPLGERVETELSPEEGVSAATTEGGSVKCLAD